MRHNKMTDVDASSLLLCWLTMSGGAKNAGADVML